MHSIKFGQKLLDCWKSKNLMIYSKVIFFKMYALSKLTYTTLLLPLLLLLSIPTGMISKIEKAAYSFLWGITDKIRCKTLLNNEIDGGLCMTDFESYLYP